MTLRSTHLRVISREREHGDLDFTDRSLSHDQISRIQEVPRRKRLSKSELRLARWLRANLEMAGAERLVLNYGAARVLETLHDGVVVVGQQLDEDATWSAYHAKVAAGIRTNVQANNVYRRQHVPAPQLHSPGGFLRSLLREGEDGH